MTEKEPKAKAPKKETAAPKAKPAVAKAAAEKPKAEKKAAPAGAQLRVTQLVGCIARRHDQRATLIGLGLNKRHRSKVLVDTPAVRGMIRKVAHLVKVENA